MKEKKEKEITFGLSSRLKAQIASPKPLMRRKKKI
jgi:hypothetical protein